MTSDVELAPAEPGDREYVESLLDESGLPTADLDTALEHLFVCRTGTGRIGVGGLERRGEYVLLRSVAVEPTARGHGYGTAICERLLERAQDDGAVAAFLLTTTAADFFARLGFEALDREDVPGPIRRTEEFVALCPEAAVPMRRELD